MVTILINEACNLEKVMFDFNQSIFVADSEGNVIFANSIAERLLSIPLSKMIGSNVAQLVQNGYYDNSPVLKAIEKKEQVTEVLNTKEGNKIIVSSQPLFDKDNNLTMVVSSSFEPEIVQKFMDVLEKERKSKHKYQDEIRYFRDRDSEQKMFVVESPLMKQLVQKARRIASTDSTVMLYGETGVGKDVIAKYIYRHSSSNEAPFVTINCAAIPESLLESELFGYERGAFTGAGNKGKPGLFEIAHNGTLFLDEIAELPLTLQPKLLRVIENGEIRKIGATKDKEVKVRIIGATNRNLQEMVDEGTFRKDLFYRLNVIPLRIPPLRDRPEDIVAIANVFLNELNTKYGEKKVFSTKSMESFVNYDWPGNVRELRNVIERMHITSYGSKLTCINNGVRLLPIIDEIESTPRKPTVDYSQYIGSLKEYLQEAEKEYIKQILQNCDGSINKAADKLDIHRSVLYRKRKAYGI